MSSGGLNGERTSSRRRFLCRGGAALLAPLLPSLPGRLRRIVPRGSATTSSQGPIEPTVMVPRVNGGINVQPLRRFDGQPGFAPPLVVPELVDLQVRQLYELGFEQMRMTLSFDSFGFGPDLIAAIPYVRAARALGIDVLGIIGQFGSGYDLVQALSDKFLRPAVLDGYVRIFGRDVEPASPTIRPGRMAFQVLNEPSNVLGIRPSEYVRVFLAPCYRHLKAAAPEIPVVSAAPVGTRNGVLRLREMLFWGLEGHCDKVGVHVYQREAIRHYAALAGKAIWVTESGVVGVASHAQWFTEVLGEVRARIAGVEQIYWYLLFDFAPDTYRLIEIVDEEEGFTARVESPALVEHLAERVALGLGDLAAVPYERLVPDIQRHFATAEDLEVIASVPTAARRR